jgi:hypothetical protein
LAVCFISTLTLAFFVIFCGWRQLRCFETKFAPWTELTVQLSEVRAGLYLLFNRYSLLSSREAAISVALPACPVFSYA